MLGERQRVYKTKEETVFCGLCSIIPLQAHVVSGKVDALAYNHFIFLKIKTKNPLLGNNDYNCYYLCHEVLGNISSP